MDCSQAAELIARTISRNASSTEEGELQRHLLACPACRERESQFRKVWTLMGRLQPLALPIERAAALSHRISGRRAGGLRWVAGLAAAAALSITVYALLHSPGPAPVGPLPVGVRTAAPAPLDEPKPATRDEVERILTRFEQEKTPIPPVTQAPEPQEPKKVEPAVPLPPVEKPQPPAPVPQPTEKKEVAREDEKPAPPVQKPAPQERETFAVAATLDRVQGSVFVVIAGTKFPAKAGQSIPAGAGLETAGQGSHAIFEFEDGSRIALGADSVLGQVWDRHTPAGKPAEGKLIQLTQGGLAAQVAKQAPVEPMMFTTPHGEARVLGTRLSLTVASSSTRLDVRQGRVKLTRKEDGASADVTEGHYALAGKGITPVAKAAPAPKIILLESFDHAKWNPALAQGGDTAGGLRFSTESGALSILVPQKAPPDVAPTLVTPGSTTTPGKIPPDVAKKAIDSVARGAAVGAKGDLPRALWLETRQTMALSNDTPLRIRARLWQSHSDADRASWIALNRAVPAGQAILLERRGGALQLWSEATQGALWKKDLPCVQDWETLELWLTKDLLVVRRNDLTVYSGANPLKVKAVQVSFGCSAKAEVAQDEESRFDDFELAWTTKADLEDVAR